MSKVSSLSLPIKAMVVFLFIAIGFSSSANILPSNGSQLNHTQIMFEYDQFFGASRYKLVIVNKNNPLKEVVAYSSSLAILVRQGLEFGSSYTWYYEAYNNSKQLFKSKIFEFSIADSYLINKAFYKYNVTVNKPLQRQDGLLFIEHLGVAINRQGEPVWFMPYDSIAGKPEPKCRNLSMTSNGTVTYLTENDCFEKTINHEDVWKGPNDGQVSGDKSEYYHHDFQKLSDGTYVVAGYLYRTEPNPANPTITARVRYNTLIQYNALGKAIWAWTDMGHLSSQTIFDGTQPTDIETAGTHLNSFFYDEKAKAFVISFRNISRIIKIDKETGNIIYQIGKRLEKDTTTLNNTDAFFSQQHGALLMPDNNLVFYNNNVEDSAKRVFPHVVILSQPLNGQPAKVLWDYECTTPAFPNGLKAKEGYALPLNNNILISMGGENRIFEVNRNKETVWECLFEKFDNSTCETKPFTNYRSHFTSSLYPKYFTVTNNSASQKVDLPFNKLTIHNDGSEDDEFTVAIASLKGGVASQKLTFNIKAGKSLTPTIKLQRKKQPQVGEELTVTVSSISNPSSFKTFSFQLTQ